MPQTPNARYRSSLRPFQTSHCAIHPCWKYNYVHPLAQVAALQPLQPWLKMIRTYVLLLLLLGIWRVTAASNECEQLGFTGIQSCSDCDSMAEYVKDAELVSDCKKCCSKDTASNTKYTNAKLEVCPYRLNGLPHIQDFIDKHSSQYQGQLKVVRQMGAYPKIILYNKDSSERTSVRIDNWRVPTIHEYLQDKLAKPVQRS